MNTIQSVDNRIGDWMETMNGDKFYPLDVRSSDINMAIIPTVLGRLCRFGGHTKVFYSVLQHSVNCAVYAICMDWSPREVLATLTHDGSEAYLIDLPRPIKRQVVGYKEIEEKAQRLIWEAYGLTNLTHKELSKVHEADDTVLRLEGIYLMSDIDKWASGGQLPHEILDRQFLECLSFVEMSPEDLVKTYNNIVCNSQYEISIGRTDQTKFRGC